MTRVELLARIAEDEAAARAACLPEHTGSYHPHPEVSRWRYRGGSIEFDFDLPDKYWSPYLVNHDGDDGPSLLPEQAGHIARWDPARVLAECEAKRQVLDVAQYLDAPWEQRLVDAVAQAYADAQ